MKKKMLFVIATIVAFVLFVPNAWAATVEVSTAADLKDKVENASDGDVIKLTADILDLANEIEVKKDITIDGDGKKIVTTARKMFVISGSASNSTVVTIKDVTMESNYSSAGWIIGTTTGSIELTLDGANLKTNGTGNNQPLTIGNTYLTGEKNNIINLVDTTIDANVSGYAIIVFNPITLTVDNSDLSGYASLYFKGAVFGAKGSAGSIVTIKNGSTLTATSHVKEAFGTVVFEENDVTVNVIDSTITANTVENSEFSAFKWNSLNGTAELNPGAPFENVKDNIVTISGTSEIKASGAGEAQIAETGSENTVVIEAGVKSELGVPAAYLPDDTRVETDGEGNMVVVPDTIILTLTGVYDGEIITDAKAEVKDIIRNTIFDDEAIEDLNDLVESINDELKEEGLLLKGLYTDKEGTKKVDLTKALADDTTWYMIFADAVQAWDGEYIFAEDAVSLSTYIVENGKILEDAGNVIYFKKGEEIPEELLEEIELLEKEVNKEYKEKGLVFLGIFYDKEGKTEVDFTKVIEEDTEWYLMIGEKVEEDSEEESKEEVKEELPPKTGDVNLAMLIGTILVGAAGAVIISKKRFAKSN